jgi:photosystem II stability/assembly factor-like uncharacterized protein
LPSTLQIQAAATADVAEPAQFGNTAAEMAGLRFAWSFGDGGVSELARPSHQFDRAGDYVVRLRVSNEYGESREASWPVSVQHQAPVRGLDCSGPGFSAWCWQAGGNAARAMQFVDAQTAWRVGDAGDIFKSVDGGLSWTRQPSGVDADLHALQFLDTQRGFVLGQDGTLLWTADGGASWQRRAAPLPQVNPQLQLRVLDAQRLLLLDRYSFWVSENAGLDWQRVERRPDAVGPAGTVWTEEHGRVYRARSLGRQPELVLTLAHEDYMFQYAAQLLVLDEQQILVNAVGERYDIKQGWMRKNMLWRSRDGGQSWQKIVPSGIFSPSWLWEWLKFHRLSAGDEVMIASHNGTPYISRDGGARWVAMRDEISCCRYGEDLLALQGQGLLFRRFGEVWLSPDWGLNWQAAEPPPGRQVAWLELLSLGPQRYLLRDNDGQFFLSSDGAQRWQRLAGSAGDRSEAAPALSFADALHGLRLSAGGELWATGDGGRTWQLRRSGLAAGAAQLQMLSATVVWMIGGDGRLQRSDDGGSSWAQVLADSRDWARVEFANRQLGWAMAAPLRPRFVATQDGGASWSALSVPAGTQALRQLDASHWWAIGEAGLLAESLDAGKTWTRRSSGTAERLQQLLASDAQTLWAVGDAGTLLRSDDGGRQWHSQTLPVSGQPALRDIHFIDAQLGWIVGAQGTVLATRDGGKTWLAQRSGTRQLLQRVRFADARLGWISGSMGTVLATGTGGF